MSRKEKMGGRHASVGCDRHIADAAQAALIALGGTRVSFGLVRRVGSALHPPGTWQRRRSDRGGGIAVLLYGDAKTVEARVYLPGDSSCPPKRRRRRRARRK